jgi:cytochrome c oxidase subunit 2
MQACAPSVWPALSAAAPLNYFGQAGGPAAAPTMHLGVWLAALCAAVVVVIAGLLAAALWRRRPKADGHTLGRAGGGMAWIYVGTGISTVALLAALVYALGMLRAVADPPSAPSLTVKVTAHDWWWEITYAQPGHPHRHFTTANELHIPVGIPVRIELDSVDVLHAFWVPQLAGKTQAIPGQVNTQWIQADAPGAYRGQCAAFCGPQHAHMAFEVIAAPPAQFEAWQVAQSRPARPPADVLALAGQKYFMRRCAACHAVRGTEADGVFGPDLTHLGTRRRIAAGTLLNTPENRLDWVRHAQTIKPDALMPGFALTPQEAEALGAYLATLQ